MIKEILTASGIPYRQGRFPNPPASTYAVTFDDNEVRGPDVLTPGAPLVVRHDCMVELYEPKPDPEAEAAFEAELLSNGIVWTKQDRYWLQNVQRYQVIYEFSYIEKRRA
jgi:hypothetical protein